MYRERIAQVYDQLSPSYRRIADFLLNRYREAAFMTAAELGEVVDVDTTTVVRCAQRLGYKGYPDLIRDVQLQVKDELQNTYALRTGAEQPTTTWQLSLLHDIENLQQALAIAPDTLHAAIDAINSARRVWVLGAGYGSAAAALFVAGLKFLGMWAEHAPTEMMAQAVEWTQVARGDVVVGVAPSAYAGEMAAALQAARDRGARIIGVFGSYASPLARIADIKLFTPAVGAGPHASITAAIALLTALLQVIALARASALETQLAEFQRTYQSLATYREREAHESGLLLSPSMEADPIKIG